MWSRLPAFTARVEAFKIHIEGRPQADIKWLFLAEMTEYFTFAEIENIVNEAGRQAISMKSFITTNILSFQILDHLAIVKR